MPIIDRIAVGVVNTFVDLVLGEHRELLLGVESALALEHELRRAEAPRPEQRRDTRGPGPLAHAVEELAVAHVVAVDELLVGEQVAVRVQDALGEAGRAGGVVELRRVVGGRVDRLEVRRTRRPAARSSRTITCSTRSGSIRSAFVGVGDQHLGLRVRDAVADALVAVEDRHREQDRAQLPGAEERGRRLGRGRQQHRDPVSPLDAVLPQHVRDLAERSWSSPQPTRRSLPRQSSQIMASLSRGCLSQTSAAML